jgi:hypothetical protein
VAPQYKPRADFHQKKSRDLFSDFYGTLYSDIILFFFTEFYDFVDDSETDSRYSEGTNISKSSSVSIL